ncbi:AMP-binding protein [Streptomyces sp. HUAS MG47]|uniref:AMP-binding protein n=1 Tax=Streptomyces solicamelliae TaxID=3231716 RepID=UPI003877AD64
MAPKEQLVVSRTVSELLQERTRERPDAVGYTYLTDGEAERETLSHADLDRRASAIAAAIHAAGAAPGDRALLLMAPGLDYVSAFFGCLYAGVVAVPSYPPDPFRPERTLPRLMGVVDDADPVTALTTSDLLGFIDGLGEHAPPLRKLRWIAVDAVPDETAAPVAVDPASTAFLQYTSGSTAAPRGVMVSHENLLHNLGMIQKYFGTDPDTQALIWLPPYHDMGLIGGLLQPLYAGCPVTLLSPLHFLEQPMRWLRMISRLGVTVSGGPNFAYELCARRATPEEVDQLDLSTWQVAFNGAEPIRPATLDRFAAVFGPAGFRADAFLSCYGLAEATLIVSGTERGTPVPRLQVDRDALAGHTAAAPGGGEEVSLVSCGSGAADQEIAIVDAGTGRRCPDGVVGEIWVSGPSVARGYWRRPEETARVFGARLAGEDADYLRTGDLGFWSEGGLVVTGRSKDLLVVRGRNHYPHDIEYTAEHAHPMLRVGCSVAFQVPDDRDEDRLVLVMEVRGASGTVDGAEITARVREAVALVHGLRAHTILLVRAGTVPKTSSGKVQRSLCRARYLAGELTEAAVERAPAATLPPATPPAVDAPAGDARPGPRDDLDHRLRALVAELLDAAPDTLDVKVPLLALGLDSLALVTLQHRMEAAFGVTVPLGDVLAGGTMEGVLQQITDSWSQHAPGAAGTGTPGDGAPSPAWDATGEARAPLSHGAREIWLMQQLDPDNPEFTVATALRLPESVELGALQKALDAVVARHPVLRTTFEVRDEELVQVVRPESPVTVRVHDVPELDEHALAARLNAVSSTPIDLVTGPLLQVDLYRSAVGEVLLVRMHHIITDFWSSTLLAREVGAFYSAYAAGQELTLAPPRATYLDVSAWRNAVLADHEHVRRSERHWLDQLEVAADTAWPRLTFPRGDGGGRDGGAIEFALTAELTDALRARAADGNATLYVLLLASFMAVLHRTTGQHDLVVGTPMMGRTRPEFADVVGCCAGTSVIRCRAAGDMPFSALLGRVRRQVIGALEHQDYPMSLLRERHGVGGRGHLVDVLFTVNQTPPRPIGDPRAAGSATPRRPGTAHDTAEIAALAQVGPAAVRGRLGSLPVEKFPLSIGGGAVPVEVVIAEVSGTAHGLLRFRAGSLDAVAADRLVRDYLAVLDRVAADPGATLSGLTDRGA